MATQKTAKIAASANGANTVVSGVAGAIIRVMAFVLSFSGTVNAKWQSSVTPTDLTGLFYGVANTQVASPQGPYRMPAGGPVAQFETLPGEDLVLNLSAGTAVGGYVVYEIVPQ